MMTVNAPQVYVEIHMFFNLIHLCLRCSGVCHEQKENGDYFCIAAGSVGIGEHSIQDAACSSAACSARLRSAALVGATALVVSTR